MQVTFYSNFSKKPNSTKRPPSTSSFTTLNVVMKGDCSVSSPVFLIDGIDLNYNYCYFNGRYYFITDIVLNRNNIYEIHCEIDVLATYKTEIGNYNAFVERAESDYDDSIIDRLLTGKQAIIQNNQSVTYIGNMRPDTGDGFYLIKVYSRDNGLGVYAFSDLTQIGVLINNSAMGLSDQTFLNLLTTGWMSIIDASQYISNVMWFPFDISILNTVSENMQIAYVTLSGVTSSRVTDKYINKSGNINMPANYYSDFRARHPSFSAYTLYLPGVGTVSIPAMEAEQGLSYSLVCDLYTGGATYYIYSNATTPALIGTYEGQLGIEIPYGKVAVSQPQLITSGAAAAITALATDNAMPLVENALHAVENVIEPAGSINSGRGSLGKIITRPYIICGLNNYGSAAFPDTVGGRPLYDYRTLHSLSGFVKCGAASLDIAGFDGEKAKVNSYLNGGFYYE